MGFAIYDADVGDGATPVLEGNTLTAGAAGGRGGLAALEARPERSNTTNG
jgi:hypothetical protein